MSTISTTVSLPGGSTMAPVRQSNIERRRLRDECRQALSRHIHERLGIDIEPSQVRLVPSTHDIYTWKILPGREELRSKLFSRNLSDHSVSALKELQLGVGVTFEAVLSDEYHTDDLVASSPSQFESSFSAQIENLCTRNAMLSRHIDELRNRVTEETQLRQRAQTEVDKLRSTCTLLEKRLDSFSTFSSRVIYCATELEKIVPVVQDLQRATSDPVC